MTPTQYFEIVPSRLNMDIRSELYFINEFTFAVAVILSAQAAGKIHTDFERGFIRAEIISPADYIALGGEVAVKEAGKMRLVGKEYVMQEGDICHFLFNN